MATKAQLEGNKRYQAKLDRIVFYVEKGEKEKLKVYAEGKGLSLNAYIQRLIDEDTKNSSSQ
ncbi:MAG: antitoxin [Angelakisella sp.]